MSTCVGRHRGDHLRQGHATTGEGADRSGLGRCDQEDEFGVQVSVVKARPMNAQPPRQTVGQAPEDAAHGDGPHSADSDDDDRQLDDDSSAESNAARKKEKKAKIRRQSLEKSQSQRRQSNENDMMGLHDMRAMAEAQLQYQRDRDERMAREAADREERMERAAAAREERMAEQNRNFLFAFAQVFNARPAVQPVLQPPPFAHHVVQPPAQLPAQTGLQVAPPVDPAAHDSM